MSFPSPSERSSLKTFWRVIRYSFPYRWKILVVIVAMILHAVFTLAPIALIQPLLDNLGSQHGGAELVVPSDEIRVTLKTGEEKLLSELIDPLSHRHGSWKERIPVLSRILKKIQSNPVLKSLFFGSKSPSPMVRLDDDHILLSSRSLEIFTTGSIWGGGEWKELEKVDPKLFSNIVSVRHTRPETYVAPLLLYAILVPILYLIKGIIGVVRQVMLASVALNLIRDIQNDLYSKILSQPVGFFHRARTGDLMSRLINDVMILSRQIVTVLMDLIQSPILVVSAVTFCFWKDWQLALTLIVTVPLLAAPMQLMSRKIRKASQRAQEKRADISSVLVETLTGIEVVKAFNMEDYERKRYADETRRLLKREMKIRKNRALATPTTEMAASFGIAAVILIAMWRMSQDPSFGLGELATIAATFTVMIKPLDRFWKARFLLGEMAVAGERIFSVMDREPEIREVPDAVEVPPHWRSIRFEKVSFAYDSEYVLRGIDFEVRRGEKIAVVGKTGAGKTTLVCLLARFYDPTEGRICIEGIDLRNLKISSLMNQIGIVTQRTVLFNDTVANNIAYGRPDISREEITAAATAAYADEFIREMPEGYDTMIGEMGTRLSGGQAQRLAIARAILKNPPILILDEATASLDTESEKKVQDALDNLMTNRTTFAIAHRLSTILNADRILVLHEGRIVESGNHRDLYAAGGYYKNLYDAQFASEPDG